MNVPHRKHGQ